MSRGPTGDAAGWLRRSSSRLWAALGATLTLFLAWAVIATHPWAPVRPVPSDPRLVALQARQERLNRAARLTDQVISRRWAAYRAQLAARRRQIAEIELRHRQELAAAADAVAAIAAHRREEEARGARGASTAATAALASQATPPARRVAPVERAATPAPPPPARAAAVARPAPVAAPAPAPAVQPPPRVEVVTLPPVKVVTLPPLVITRTS